MDSLVRTLGHAGRTIDILKVDIEGYEYEAFAHKSLFGACNATGKLGTPFHLLLIEMHMTDGPMGTAAMNGKARMETIARFFRSARACGLALFSKERCRRRCRSPRPLPLAASAAATYACSAFLNWAVASS